MSKRYINKKHLKWVHSLECTIYSYFKSEEMMGNSYITNSLCCYGVIQAHHLLKPHFSSRAMSMKAGDKDVIPLCMKCHTELHKTGNELKFFYNKTNNENYGKQKAIQTWLSSPYYEKEKNKISG
tara:strand:+ start:567 stop:941 length:375 start_codon:yes stop_codon:yes gene_type:complete